MPGRSGPGTWRAERLSCTASGAAMGRGCICARSPIHFGITATVPSTPTKAMAPRCVTRFSITPTDRPSTFVIATNCQPSSDSPTCSVAFVSPEIATTASAIKSPILGTAARDSRSPGRYSTYAFTMRAGPLPSWECSGSSANADSVDAPEVRPHAESIARNARLDTGWIAVIPTS